MSITPSHCTQPPIPLAGLKGKFCICSSCLCQAFYSETPLQCVPMGFHLGKEDATEGQWHFPCLLLSHFKGSKTHRENVQWILQPSILVLLSASLWEMVTCVHINTMGLNITSQSSGCFPVPKQLTHKCLFAPPIALNNKGSLALTGLLLPSSSMINLIFISQAHPNSCHSLEIHSALILIQTIYLT